MAIVRMKKLNLLASRSQKDELLRELMLLGCVQLSDQEYLLNQPETYKLLTRMESDAADWRARKTVLESALKLLEKYVPKKTPMLAPKPEVAKSVIMDETELEKARQIAKEINFLDERMKSYAAEETRQSLLIEALTPWQGFDLPLETTGTKNVAVTLGTVPATENVGEVLAQLGEELEPSHIIELGSDANMHYICAFYMRSDEDTAMRVLREHGFAYPAFGMLKGTASENINEYRQEVERLQGQIKSCKEQLEAYSDSRELLKLCIDRVQTRIERAEATELLMKTQQTVVLEGWAEESFEPQLCKLLDSYDCAYELTEPTKDEYPEVPVKLKNNKLTEGLNMVTNMYSLPQYGSVDPNPLMAPFFILFYGIMMADMGYGLVMMLIGLLILKKKRPKEGFMRYFALLMLEGGVATFVMGALSGGFFGDALTHIVQLINPNTTWEGLPALFNPLEDTIMILVGAMILGFIQLITGMVISFVMKARDGRLVDAIFDEGCMWIFFAGLALTFLGVGKVNGIPVPLIIGLVAFAAGKMHPAKGAAKFMAIFSGLYNEATGWFGDILSYARLMALMLAGSVIAQVFNTLGAMPGSIIVFIPIFLFGNALNFGLNLLGCYVHDLRLQCLEFFNKFYVDGGKPFKPLAVHSKYYDVTNN